MEERLSYLGLPYVFSAYALREKISTLTSVSISLCFKNRDLTRRSLGGITIKAHLCAPDHLPNID